MHARKSSEPIQGTALNCFRVRKNIFPLFHVLVRLVWRSWFIWPTVSGDRSLIFFQGEPCTCWNIFLLQLLIIINYDECCRQMIQLNPTDLIGRYVFFPLFYGIPANISRKHTTGGMASQHLRTFERMDIFKSADLNVVFIWIS